MKFPHEIDGWLTEVEGAALARLAAGKRVVEIGSYCGRSTVCIAQTAEHVTAVDYFDGRGTPEPRETLSAFRVNVNRYGLGGKVTPGHPDDVLPPCGFAFIDGDHTYPAVKADIAKVLHVLEPGGLIAFHDYRLTAGEYDGRWDAGVTAAVDELLDGGAELVERAGSIAVVNPANYKPHEKQVVCLALPRYSETVCFGTTIACREAVKRPTRVLELGSQPTSLLNHGFNTYLAQALDCRDLYGATHFAMIHADIQPQNGWLTVLLDELTRLDADIVSAVVPLKDERGLTSTAVYDGNDPWERRRLTLAEVAALPETFCAEDGEALLLNTGLWVCDLRKPWVDEFAEQGGFHSLERIVRVNDRRRAEVVSEDWLLSHWLNQRGGKLYATNKVRLSHWGVTEFTSGEPWGAWTTDLDASHREASPC